MHHRPAAGLTCLFIALACHAQDGGKQTRPTPEEARQEARRWSRTAVKDISRVHRIIEQAHPAILDPQARAFHQWFREGHDQAMALARRATTPQRAFAALRFYTSGYRDNHLVVWSRFNSATSIWAGWAVERHGGRYQVSGRAAHWPVDTPRVGEQVLSCDGRPLDDLLADKVAPFVTRLMHLESTKSYLAWHLTHESPTAPLWEPLRVRQCTTRTTTGEIRHYGMEWQPLEGKESEALEQHRRPRQCIQQIRPGVHWVHASNFQPKSRKAVARFEQMLDGIRQTGDAQAVVLDVRGNGGGNSLLGYRILLALLTDAIVKKDAAQPQQPRAYWRVSNLALEAFEERKAQYRDTEGEDSPVYQFTQQMASLMRDAASRGQDFVEQPRSSTSHPEFQQDAAQERAHRFSGQLVLVTDAYCMSACLDFVSAALRIPGVVHVGSPTGADTPYTDVADKALSPTVMFRIPLKVWKNHGRQDKEGKPYVPQFVFDGDLADTAAVQAWVLDSILPAAAKIQLD
ncbi:MAG: peptidase S41 [Delftia acidovorans]|nr:peptidase S41 [Delftia acidovorans]